MNTNRAVACSSARAGASVAHARRLERRIASQPDDLTVRAHLNLPAALDLIDEVARHRLAQVPAAYQQAAARGVL